METDPGTGVPDDVAQLGSELRVVVGRITRRLRHAHEAGELTLAELSVLSRLERCGTSQAGVLAEQERITPQAMSAILAVLEEREFVARDADASDGRRFQVSATESGQRLLAGRRSRMAQMVAQALDDEFSPAERQQLADAVPLLDRLAERL